MHSTTNPHTVSPSTNGDTPIPPARGVALSSLRPGERAVLGLVALLVLLLGAIGAVNSFEAVADAVRPSFGDLAWTVPLGVDVGIAVFTALDLVLARLGMRMRLLRLVPWLLVGVTVYLNVAGETEPVGAVAHGVLPLLWVLAVDVAAHVARVRAGLAHGHDNPKTGGGGRPAGTVGFWRYLAIRAGTRVPWLRRGMVLIAERNYDTAVRRAQQQDLVRAELRDRYGRMRWRWRTPAAKRVMYRWGTLAPSPALLASLDDNPATATPGPTTTPPGPPAGRRRSKPTRRTSAADVDVSDVLPAAREAAAALAAAGDKVTRQTLRPALRDRGVRLATAKLGVVIAALRAEGVTS
jgi:uncharacterized protein DUF2637